MHVMYYEGSSLMRSMLVTKEQVKSHPSGQRD